MGYQPKGKPLVGEPVPPPGGTGIQPPWQYSDMRDALDGIADGEHLVTCADCIWHATTSCEFTPNVHPLAGVCKVFGRAV